MAEIQYRLVRFAEGGRPVCGGVLWQDRVIALRELGMDDDAGTAWEDASFGWPGFDGRVKEALARVASGAVPRRELQAVRLASPLGRYGVLYCAGVNYRDHVEEMALVQGRPPEPDPRSSGFEPWHFIKPSRSCVADPDTVVIRPRGCQKLDWEAELAVVIGVETREVSPQDALRRVAGYMVANDLSARDLSRRLQPGEGSPFRFDWLAHKGFQGSCPLGPWLTPAEAIPDPQQLQVSLRVNGVLKQNSTTAEMIYSAAEQISHLSGLRTLYPGDVILTGTPSGVGSARQEFLQPGDEVEVEIAGLGRLRNIIG